MVSQIKWGAALANTLTFEYGLYETVTDREPREGSEWAEAPSGVRDALIVGKDYTMTCEVRFIPDTSGSYSVVSGAASWQDFLDWCRGANSFRLIPNTGAPSIFIDPCYLAEPMSGFGREDEMRRRSVRLKFINPTYDFTSAFLGTLYTGP